MVKVNLTRGEWDQVSYVLGKYTDNVLMLSIWNQIQDQLDSQEY